MLQLEWDSVSCKLRYVTLLEQHERRRWFRFPL